MLEGATELPFDAPPNIGPGAIDAERAFYNPAMALNRDLSVLLVAAHQAKLSREIDVADVLTGAGARSLRLLHEIDAPVIVHSNDGDERVLDLPAHERHRITHNSAHGFLASQRFDVVDIDPFGSPQPFLDSAIRATRHGGLVCLTATDTAALCGTYPRVCKRRYDAEPLHGAPWRQEVALRIMAGAAVRAAGRFDRVATPVLSYFGGHWLRVVLRVEDKRGIPQVSRVCVGELGRGMHGDEGAGPVWAGPLHDTDFVADLQKQLPRTLADSQWDARLQLFAEEANAPAYWPDPTTIHRETGVSLPRRSQLVAALEAKGWQAGPSHMDPVAIRTNAPTADLIACWRAAKA